MKIEEIEKELDKLKPLKFSIKKEQPKNYKDCIDRVIQGEATFMNSDIYPQCHSNKARGTADIYRTCKFYFPNTKLKDVINYIKPKAKDFCTTTNQTVFYRYGNNNYIIRIRIGHSSKKPVTIEN